MDVQHEPERPFRAGIFNTVSDAEEAVHALLAAGFTSEQISVVCSDEVKERHFREYEHTEPAGTNTPAAAAVGSAVGAAVIGATTATLGSMFSLDAAAAMGGAGLWTGTIFGGFVGAMMSRAPRTNLPTSIARQYRAAASSSLPKPMATEAKQHWPKRSEFWPKRGRNRSR